MDSERLKQIKRRVARATAPPWQLGSHRGFGEEHDVEGPDGHGLSGIRSIFYYRADAEFVSHAREDVPALIEALEGTLDESEQASKESWLDQVPEPWASVLKTEIHSRPLKARRILDAAAADEESYLSAREKVRELELDPDGIPRFDPDE